MVGTCTIATNFVSAGSDYFFFLPLIFYSLYTYYQNYTASHAVSQTSERTSTVPRPNASLLKGETALEGRKFGSKLCFQFFSFSYFPDPSFRNDSFYRISRTVISIAC